MKYVKLFCKFKIGMICKKYGIKNYTINPDGSIDVDGNIGLRNIGMISLPLKFNKVNGYFSCSVNNITTLEGSPNYVGMNFHCQDTSITTLKGAPSHVGIDFYCSNNMLLTFEGAPNHIGNFFTCNNTPIYNIWNLFEDYSKVELLNDYDALRIENGNGICILSRLNGFLEDIGKPRVTDKQIEEISEYYEIR